MNDCNDNKNYTKTSNSRLGCFGLILICILSVIIVVFSPIIAFGVAYFLGWIMSLFIGNIVANGLNVVFATDRFTPDIIPLFYGTMGLIGSFFRPKSGIKAVEDSIDRVHEKLREIDNASD